MIAKASPTNETEQRLNAEMLRVHAVVRRDFIRAGILTGTESDPWPQEKKWGKDLQKVAASAECDRLTCVFFAAEVVQLTYKSLGGGRETAIDALTDLASAIRRVDAAMGDAGVRAYLESVGNVGWQLALQDEPRVDSRDLPRMLSGLDWEMLKDAAHSADLIADHLRLRRPAAWYANAYAAKGAGPFAHFCHELHHGDGFPIDAIADITGELPKRSAYGSHDRWVEACEQTCERLRQQIGRFDRKVKATARA